MSDSAENSSRPTGLLSLRSASGFVRSVFARERQVTCDNQFNQFLKVLEEREYRSVVAAREAIDSLYHEWARSYELLKSEFNQVWDLFQSVEDRVQGWYCVSPNLAQWKTVGSSKFGYTFAACIMKNHHRDAPLSEKSVSVSFGLDDQPQGIGDERLIGYQGEVSDTLAGLEGCTPRCLHDQGDGMRALYQKLETKQLTFRLNHRSIGQQTTRLPISVLQEYSLKELCQGLFLMVNNDIITELNGALSTPQKLLTAVETAQLEWHTPSDDLDALAVDADVIHVEAEPSDPDDAFIVNE